MSITKRIPIAIGIKPSQEVTFTNKTIDGTQNTLQNIPTGALQFNTISINNQAIELGGNINIQVEGGSPIIDTNTTYSIKASSISGGARFDLDAGGTGTGTDSISFIGGGTVTVSRSDDNTIVISDAGGGVAGNFITATSSDTLLNKDIDGNNNTISNIANTSLTNSSITINNTEVPLGGTITIAGGGGGGDVTAESETTFRNKTISGINNTLQSIDKSSIKEEHRYISINGTQVELGTNFDVSGLGDVTTTGTQDLSNKSLLAPVISNGVFLEKMYIGSANSGGSPGQVIKATTNGAQWANETRTTETSLSIGSGLIGSNNATEFDGSNGVTISVNTTVVATLTGTQTLSNKTLTSPTLTDETYDVTLPTLAANDQLVTEDATQTLTNKTLDAVNLTGDLTIGGVSGTSGYAIVSDGAGGLTWGQASGGGGGGSGDVTGPSGAGDNAIARYDALTGKIIQDSLVTISDQGAIVAPATSSIIPFLYAQQSDFPDAATYHGAIAHSHADGAMFFAHSGSWTQLANASDVQVSSRTTHTANIGSMGNNTSANSDLTVYKSYLLFKIETSAAAWVRVYASGTARTNDASRTIDTDPSPGSGVIAEVITTGSQTQLLTPAVIGFNDDATPSSTMYLRVTNVSGGTANINVTVTALKLEA